MEGKDAAKLLLNFIGVLFFLYFFLIALDLLGSAFKVIAGESAGDLFTSVSNPVAGLMVGILATVLVQSSSTTTSIIVTAVGANVLPIKTAIPMIFGANIGTSVTNTIVSMGFFSQREEMRRGFAGATVHDMFNYMNVCFWFPVELIIQKIAGKGPLQAIGESIVFNGCDDTESDCESWTGPFKTITSFVTKKIINADKDVIADFALGVPSLESCDALCAEAITGDATECIAKTFKQKRCFSFPEDQDLAAATTVPEEMNCLLNDNEKIKAEFDFCGIDENKKTFVKDQVALDGAIVHYNSFIINKGGILADELNWQEEAGIFVLVLSIIMLIIALLGLVKCLQRTLGHFSEEAVKKALDMNGYVAIVIGALVTMLVQSSSITTSTLTPLCAMGSLTLESMLPLTLGANIGTTLTGILAALQGDSTLGFAIALVHVFFNVFGVVLFYPVPFIRAIPLRAARNLGSLAGTYKSFPLVYLAIMFFVYPGALLGISIAFSKSGAGAGVGVLLVFLAVHAGILYWYKKMGGRDYLVAAFGQQGKDLEEGPVVVKDDDDEEPATLEIEASKGGPVDPELLL